MPFFLQHGAFLCSSSPADTFSILQYAAGVGVIFLENRTHAVSQVFQGIAVIKPDQRAGGLALGHAFCERMSKESLKMVVLQGARGRHDICAQRWNGFLQAIKQNPKCAHHNASVAYVQNLDCLSQAPSDPFPDPSNKPCIDSATEFLSDLMTLDGTINSIFTCSDDMAMGAVAAARATHPTGTRRMTVYSAGASADAHTSEDVRLAALSGEISAAVAPVYSDISKAGKFSPLYCSCVCAGLSASY